MMTALPATALDPAAVVAATPSMKRTTAADDRARNCLRDGARGALRKVGVSATGIPPGGGLRRGRVRRIGRFVVIPRPNRIVLWRTDPPFEGTVLRFVTVMSGVRRATHAFERASWRLAIGGTRPTARRTTVSARAAQSRAAKDAWKPQVFSS